jgi:hypothetical protein
MRRLIVTAAVAASALIAGLCCSVVQFVATGGGAFNDGEIGLAPREFALGLESDDHVDLKKHLPNNAVAWAKFFSQSFIRRLPRVPNRFTQEFPPIGHLGANVPLPWLSNDGTPVSHTSSTDKVQLIQVMMAMLLFSVGLLGVLIAIMVPYVMLTWWFLSHPAIPQPQLSVALGYLDPLMMPLDRLLKPLLSVVFQYMGFLGAGGVEARTLGDARLQSEAALRAKRVLLGLVMLAVAINSMLLLAILYLVLTLRLLVTGLELIEVT